MNHRQAPKRVDEHRGLVFDIQRFCVHDGPGIRTTVFMKGCPLRCLWCSNPESQEPRPNLMVRDANCRRCGACQSTCPEAAIGLDKARGRTIDWEKCRHCLECTGACVYGALASCGQTMEVDEIVAELMRDDAFYRNSGGGVTVSGGEPLSQSVFVARVLEECKGRGLHTAVDTSGYAPWERMEAVLSFTDLILFDIKHLDSDEHREATGVGNEVILQNLFRASKVDGTGLWLRLPLVAGFNDSEEHVRRIAELGKDVGAKKISLLPYHEGGLSKCRELGRPYGYPNGSAPNKKRLTRLKNLVEGIGLSVAISH